MTLYDSMIVAADLSQVPGLSRFFKTGQGQYGEDDKFLGIKVPVTRAIVNAHCRELAASGSPFTELERCITSEYHEVRLAALLALVEVFRHTGNSKRQRHSERSEESPRYRQMPRTMLCYAIEKFPEDLRQWYLKGGSAL